MEILSNVTKLWKAARSPRVIAAIKLVAALVAVGVAVEQVVKTNKQHNDDGED